MNSGLEWMDLTELAGNLRERRLSAVEVLEATLARAEVTEPWVHAYTGLMVDEARSAARRADREIGAGEYRGPLHGVPVAVKDLCATAGHETAAGSRVRAGFVPERDATVVALLRQAGAVIIGKTVTHEFGYGLNAPATVNAWAPGCYPGGSSAGSAVSVAVGSAYAAIGTDTAGSIRVPAALNGVVGFKPTYGRVGRAGVQPLSPSMDTVGPLARSVRDCARVLQAVAGRPGGDRTAIDEPVGDLVSSLRQDLTAIRIGVERNHFFYGGVQPGVRAATAAAIKTLTGLGAEIVPVELGHLDDAVSAGTAVMHADASEWHDELLRSRGPEYDPATARMLQFGHMVLAVAYVKAQKVRTVVQAEIRRCFERNRLDAIAAPTVPITTMPASQLAAPLEGTEESAFWALNHHSIIANVVGLPALSVPAGFDGAGKPAGMQLIGRPFAERVLLDIGNAYELAQPWHRQHPRHPFS